MTPAALLRDAAIAAALTLTTWCSIAPRATAKEPSAAPTASAVRGIVHEKPSNGQFVKVDGGFMVPYRERIPGTDVEFEMIPVPGGEFLMGSPDDEANRADDEGPQVRIKVAPFWIGKTEVTWGEYKSYMAMYDAFKKLQLVAVNRAKQNGADGDEQDALKMVAAHAWDGQTDHEAFDGVTSATPLYSPDFTYSAGDEPNQPAVTMTQFAARQYTKWLSGITGEQYRLPTEAEWEYAARAGTTTPYSFGDSADELDQYAWFDANSDYATHPVGEKKPNAWGLYDMHGNVAEWTLDQYQEKAYESLGDDLTDAWSAVRWPTKAYPHVIRGGSWLDTPEMLRSAARFRSESTDDEWKLSDPNFPLSPWWYTEDVATGVGMRIVRPLAPIPAEDEKRVWDAEVESIAQDVRDRLDEGRGAIGIADESLPAAIEAAKKLDAEQVK